jgi:DNA-binding CsgD family transcriptional regulator
MKIKYEFDNGEVTEVEVDEEIGTFILESRRQESNLDRKERAHCLSLDAIDYEGSEFGAWDKYEDDDDIFRSRRVRKAFSQLSETQQRRLKLYADGKTLREIAEIEGASFQSVDESIRAARKKFSKNF